MKNRSRLAILGAVLLLGGASIILLASGGDLPGPAFLLGASQQEQTGEHQDAAGNQQDQAGDKGGHQDGTGAPGQTGDHQD